MTCQGCGKKNVSTEPIRLGQQSVQLCNDCIKEWELDK